MNEPAPAETEESRLRNRQLTLDVRRVEFIDCAFHIPAVASSPFTFRAHMIDGFKGTDTFVYIIDDLYAATVTVNLRAVLQNDSFDAAPEQ